MAAQETENVLEVENLVKDFGDFRAVKGISFSVPRGKIVGFLGPNGAGKTTTIHMLLGVTLHSAGTIQYFGKDFSENREACLQRINFASAFNTLLGRISVIENLYVFAELYQVKDAKKKIKTLLERFEIEDIAEDIYWHLSAGQRTRVNLTKSLLNDPEVLLMDEPTASLDPDIADKTMSFIEELRAERGLSILYTSHNMAEVTRICDEVIFLDKGAIVAHDTPHNLAKQISSATLQVTFSDGRDKVESYLREKNLPHTFVTSHTVDIPLKESIIPETLFGLSHMGITITDIEIQKPTLEDVFLRIARIKV